MSADVSWAKLWLSCNYPKPPEKPTPVFLKNFSSEEKLAFLNLAKHIAMTDSRLCELESLMLKVFCNEMDLPVNAIPDSPKWKEALVVFQHASNRVKRAALLEILAIAMVDDQVKPHERHTVLEFASTVGIPDEVRIKGEAWAKEISEVTKRGFEFVGQPF